MDPRLIFSSLTAVVCVALIFMTVAAVRSYVSGPPAQIARPPR
jgi:hypothetical protein